MLQMDKREIYQLIQTSLVALILLQFQEKHQKVPIVVRRHKLGALLIQKYKFLK